MATIDSKLIAANNRPTGFDYLRIILATSIVIWHSVVTSYGGEYQLELWRGPLRPFLKALLICFFTLSVFLVAGSLDRNSTLRFAWLRIVRIFPALSVEVVHSSLLIGPMFTTSTLSDYFWNRHLYSYFFNILGSMHYHLPGLFLSNPFPDVVNAQLWTVPFEFECYILLILLALFRISRRPIVLCLIAVVLAVLFVSQDVADYKMPTSGFGDGAFGGRKLVLAFLCGVIIDRMKATLISSSIIAVICGLAAYVLLLGRYGQTLAVPLLAYVTIYVGSLNIRDNPVLRAGDLSYGIFLYGFVIEQSLASLTFFPKKWYVMSIAAVVLSALIAQASWTYVEKPSLKLRYFDPVSSWRRFKASRQARHRCRNDQTDI